MTESECAHNVCGMDTPNLDSVAVKRSPRAVHLSDSDYRTVSDIAALSGTSRSSAVSQAIALLVAKLAKRQRKETRPWDGSASESSAQ